MQASIGSIFRLSRYAAWTALVCALSSGCAWQEEMTARQARILERMEMLTRDHQRFKERQEQRESTLRQNLGIALGKLFCTDARVQAFLRTCSMPHSGALTPQIGGCSEKERNSVLTFMTSQNHVVVYLPEKKGREAIIPPRKAQIQQILKENRLLSTEYYVFAHPLGQTTADSVSEAEKRAGEVVDYIRDVAKEMVQKAEGSDAQELKELKELKLRSPQVFPYRLTGNDIEGVLRRNYQIDRPIGREPKDLRLGIWIFRTDCQPPKDL